MIRRPPRSTRTDTLFPYTTLFRSQVICEVDARHLRLAAAVHPAVDGRLPRVERARGRGIELAPPRIELSRIGRAAIGAALKEGVQREVAMAAVADADALRSDERRVGQEGVSPCISRWSQYHSKK